MPVIFGIRHLSPAGGWNLLRLLDETHPKLILLEAPSDLIDLMPALSLHQTKPPIAMMAYSETVPIETIIYPLAEYSPEYQAVLWCAKNKSICRFIDLPASVFLAIEQQKRARRNEEISETLKEGKESTSAEDNGEDIQVHPINAYERIAKLSGEVDHETYWERNFEHISEGKGYHLAATEYGKQLRAIDSKRDYDSAENLVREAYMKRMISTALEEGYSDDEIVVVCGAFHVAGLESCTPMTDEEEKSLPRISCKQTLMPYSYYRLSSMSGYGAGNCAPAYYGMLWNSMQKGDNIAVTYQYLSSIASYQREHGWYSSSAEVIEAVRLATTLAQMKNGNYPTLRDLKDAAITCLGHGNIRELTPAFAAIEVGTKIGALPEGVSQTSVQADFSRCLHTLKLEKYKTLLEQELELDLRENTRVKSEKAAFLDLERSFFLHRMQFLSVQFAKKQHLVQDKATWAERWDLQWTPEAEIQIVETALKGDTIELATAFLFRTHLDEAQNISDTAKIIDEACLCGLPETVGYATDVLQGLAVDAASVIELAKTAQSLSSVIRYGNIRKLNPAPLLPILQQLFLRACLILPDNCACNNSAVGDVIEAMGMLGEIAIAHDFVDGSQWIGVLTQISNRDDINTKASGYATAILMERGLMDSTLLAAEVQRRLSKGIPADLGAGWFEGLALKNRHTLIARLSLWEQLDNYLDTLGDTEFKRALVFLRRAFSEFTPNERSMIAENIGELWNTDSQQVSEAMLAPVSEEEQQIFEELSDFDFGDL